MAADVASFAVVLIAVVEPPLEHDGVDLLANSGAMGSVVFVIPRVAHEFFELALLIPILPPLPCRMRVVSGANNPQLPDLPHAIPDQQDFLPTG